VTTYGVKNNSGILIIYGDSRSELEEVSGVLAVFPMTAEDLKRELGKALDYYTLRNS